MLRDWLFQSRLFQLINVYYVSPIFGIKEIEYKNWIEDLDWCILLACWGWWQTRRQLGIGVHESLRVLLIAPSSDWRSKITLLWSDRDSKGQHRRHEASRRLGLRPESSPYRFHARLNHNKQKEQASSSTISQCAKSNFFPDSQLAHAHKSTKFKNYGFLLSVSNRKRRCEYKKWSIALRDNLLLWFL